MTMKKSGKSQIINDKNLKIIVLVHRILVKRNGCVLVRNVKLKCHYKKKDEKKQKFKKEKKIETFSKYLLEYPYGCRHRSSDNHCSYANRLDIPHSCCTHYYCTQN